eukprot:TRINITY_DN964_c0_g1_i2.p1 TRINITY_DN964_c0_g1~~TRINITY_DN964_c0_g1_i2.p1  ORF type:complete len:276 (-),score=28.26 TRINITY_DN964_c0_g1_i2:193-1020(-)
MNFQSTIKSRGYRIQPIHVKQISVIKKKLVDDQNVRLRRKNLIASVLETQTPPVISTEQEIEDQLGAVFKHAKNLFTNVEQEVSCWIPEDMVEGTIPVDIEGTLFRNGPGLFERGGVQMTQPMDGDGMLNKFSFKNGKIHYMNKQLRLKQLTNYKSQELSRSFGKQEVSRSQGRQFLYREKTAAARKMTDIQHPLYTHRSKINHNQQFWMHKILKLDLLPPQLYPSQFRPPSTEVGANIIMVNENIRYQIMVQKYSKKYNQNSCVQNGKNWGDNR